MQTTSHAIPRTLARLLLAIAMATLAACENMPKLAKVEPVEPIEPVYDYVEPLESSGFDEETLYRLLTAEIAGRQENHQLALENYLWAARHTNNIDVIARATSIANFTGDEQIAEELAELWLQQKPDANRPHLTLASIALGNQDVDQAVRHLTNVMQQPGLAAAKMWLISSALENAPKNLKLQTLDRLVENFADDAQTRVAYGRTLLQLDEVWRAERVFAELLASDPENEQVVVLYMSTLRNQGQEQKAADKLRQIIAEQPEQDALRSYFARILVDLELYREAATQLVLLAENNKDNADELALLAAVQIEMGEEDKARKTLEKLVWVESGEYSDRAAWQLGKIAEDNGQTELALKWYRSIDDPMLAASAKVRSVPLTHQGDATATMAAFDTLALQQPQLANEVNEVRAIWLAENDRYDEAMEIYDTAIEQDDTTFWRYSRAITAEQYGDDLELFEQDMRHIIKQDQNNAEALNALGYTMADRTDRYDEAYGLIYRARLLKPNNFYIMDSMGWVLFRLGHNKEALEHLNKAYNIRKDPEIAAHIVEVLVSMGNKNKARKVLRKNEKLFAEDKKLQAVRARFSL